MAHRKAIRPGRSRQGGSSASVGAAMSGAIIIAKLIGHLGRLLQPGHDFRKHLFSTPS